MVVVVRGRESDTTNLILCGSALTGLVGYLWKISERKSSIKSSIMNLRTECLPCKHPEHMEVQARPFYNQSQRYFIAYLAYTKSMNYL